MDIIIITVAFLLVISLNLIINYIIIRTTLKYLIIPRLHDLGVEFIRIEKVGFFKTGDFKDQALKLRPFNSMGRFNILLYRYIFYRDKSKREKRVTVRINWNFFRKTRIDFTPI